MRVEHPTYYGEVLNQDYPFETGVSRSNGRATIDRDVFVDGRIFPPRAVGTVYLSEITAGAKTVLTIADSSGPLGQASFWRQKLPRTLTFHSSAGAYLGVLVSPDAAALGKLSGWPNGRYVFLPEQTRFAATVVVPQPQVCVRAVETGDGRHFTGDVYLVGERGVQLTVPPRESSSEINGCFSGDVRVDVIGDPLFARRQCLEEGVMLEDPRLLQEIVFAGVALRPDNSGRFHLRVGTPEGTKPALRILPELAALRIEFVGPNVRR